MVDGPDRVKLVKKLEKYHLALAIDDCSPIPTRLAFDVRERRFSPTMKQPAFCSATRSCPNLNRVLRVRIWTITCNDQPHQIDVDRVELINSDPLRVKSRPVDPNSTRGFCLHATEEEEESRPSGLTLSGLFPHASRPKGRTDRMVRLSPQIYALFTNDRKNSRLFPQRPDGEATHPETGRTGDAQYCPGRSGRVSAARGGTAGRVFKEAVGDIIGGKHVCCG